MSDDVSGPSLPDPSPHGSGRPPRWRDREWWFGRTPAQMERKAKAREEFRIAREELREARGTASRERAASRSGGAQPQGVAARIGEIGRTLTIVLTLPIIAAALFGPVGLIIAIVIAVVLLVGRRR